MTQQLSYIEAMVLYVTSRAIMDSKQWIFWYDDKDKRYWYKAPSGLIDSGSVPLIGHEPFVEVSTPELPPKPEPELRRLTTLKACMKAKTIKIKTPPWYSDNTICPEQYNRDQHWYLDDIVRFQLALLNDWPIYEVVDGGV